jgi:hypothetical protein
LRGTGDGFESQWETGVEVEIPSLAINENSADTLVFVVRRIVPKSGQVSYLHNEPAA